MIVKINGVPLDIFDNVRVPDGPPQWLFNNYNDTSSVTIVDVLDYIDKVNYTVLKKATGNDDLYRFICSGNTEIWDFIEAIGGMFGVN